MLRIGGGTELARLTVTFQGNPHLQKKAMHGLLLLTQCGVDRNAVRALLETASRGGLVPAAVAALRSKDPELGYFAAGVLHELAHHKVDAGLKRVPRLVQTVHRTLLDSGAGTQNLLLRVVGYLALRDDDFKLELLRVGLCARLLVCIVSGDVTLAHWAIVLLHDIAMLGKEACSHIAALPGCFPALQKLAARGSQYALLVAETIGFICSERELRGGAVDAGLLDIVDGFLTSDDDELHVWAITLLLHIALPSTQLRSRVLAAGFLQRLCTLAVAGRPARSPGSAVRLLGVLAEHAPPVAAQVVAHAFEPLRQQLSAVLETGGNAADLMSRLGALCQSRTLCAALRRQSVASLVASLAQAVHHFMDLSPWPQPPEGAMRDRMAAAVQSAPAAARLLAVMARVAPAAIDAQVVLLLARSLNRVLGPLFTVQAMIQRTMMSRRVEGLPPGVCGIAAPRTIAAWHPRSPPRSPHLADDVLGTPPSMRRGPLLSPFQTPDRAGSPGVPGLDRGTASPATAVLTSTPRSEGPRSRRLPNDSLASLAESPAGSGVRRTPPPAPPGAGVPRRTARSLSAGGDFARARPRTSAPQLSTSLLATRFPMFGASDTQYRTPARRPVAAPPIVERPTTGAAHPDTFSPRTRWLGGSTAGRQPRLSRAGPDAPLLPTQGAPPPRPPRRGGGVASTRPESAPPVLAQQPGTMPGIHPLLAEGEGPRRSSVFASDEEDDLGLEFSDGIMAPHETAPSLDGSLDSSRLNTSVAGRLNTSVIGDLVAETSLMSELDDDLMDELNDASFISELDLSIRVPAPSPAPDERPPAPTAGSDALEEAKQHKQLIIQALKQLAELVASTFVELAPGLGPGESRGAFAALVGSGLWALIYAIPSVHVGFHAVSTLALLACSPDEQGARVSVRVDPVAATPWLSISPSGLAACNTMGLFESGRASGCSRADGGLYYYEALIQSDGLLQLGWVTDQCEFKPTLGLGVGDDAQSVAYDGCRCRVWHGAPETEGVPYGETWSPGDVVGCLLDCATGVAAFYLNGTCLGTAVQDLAVGTSWYPAFS